jgi:hypothetical protein
VAGEAVHLEDRLHVVGEHDAALHFQLSVLWPGGAFRDPLLDRDGLRLVQRWTLGRHNLGVIGRQDNPPVEQALFGIARDDRRAGRACRRRGLERVETQVAFGVRLLMATQAGGLDDRLDLAVEVDRRSRFQGNGDAGCAEQQADRRVDKPVWHNAGMRRSNHGQSGYPGKRRAAGKAGGMFWEH